MAQILSLRPSPKSLSSNLPSNLPGTLPALVTANPAPPLARALLRTGVTAVLLALWGKLAVGGAAEGYAYLHGITGSRVLALGVEAMGVLFLLMTTLKVALWLRYRPAPLPAAGSELPTVTALVPAYNEGAMVRHALLSLVGSDYPQEKLQIIAIDDGSRDDTYSHMEAAARLAPGRILLLRQPQNRGKRAALQAGFHAARSEIVITVDSDCILAPDAVRQMVAPFADPKVGAVAGRVVIHNKKGSWLTRLMSPQFTMTFDFLRAAQSVNGTVLCCPGALSAFRLAVVRKVLPHWLEQRFLGTKVGPGEDRFLTTLVLREGFESRYQATARVHTLVPTQYSKVCKMYLRWDRCDLRESIEALWLWPKRTGLARLTVIPYLGFAFETLFTVPVTVVGLVAMGALAVTHPLSALVALLGVNFSTALSMMLCLSSDFEAETALLWAYSWFWPAISWIMPYAALTLNDQAWMSREASRALPASAIASPVSQPARSQAMA